MKIAMKKTFVKMLAPALLAFYSTSAFASVGTSIKNKIMQGADESTIIASGVVVFAIIWGAIQSMVLKIPVSRWLYVVIVGGLLVAFAPEIGEWFSKR